MHYRVTEETSNPQILVFQNILRLKKILNYPVLCLYIISRDSQGIEMWSHCIWLIERSGVLIIHITEVLWRRGLFLGI